MLCVPTARELTVKVASPESSGALPRTVAASMKVTVPVGEALVEATCAVKVTGFLRKTSAEDVVSVIVAVAGCTT